MEKNPSNKQQTVDLVYLFRVLRTHIAWILLLTVAGAVLFGGIRLFVHTNDYETQVKFLINGFTQTDEGVKVNVAQTSSGNNLAHSFPDLLKSNNAMNAAINHIRSGACQGESAGMDCDAEDIRDMISRVSVDNQVVTVHIRHTDKDVAYSIAKAIEHTIPVVVDYYLGIENIGSIETRSSVVKVLNGPDDIGVNKTGMGVLTFAVIGAVAGFLISLFVFFLVDYFDNGLYSEDDLKSIFDTVPVIGQIPTWEETDSNHKDKNDKEGIHFSKLSKRQRAAENLKREYDGRLLGSHSPFAISEAFKLLRTNMCYTTKGEACAVYAVTSAYIGAGKSVITANTAISFAQMGKRVLIIDADLRCPAQQAVFKLPRLDNGLSEALAGVCAVRQVYIHKNRFPGLDIITSGRIPPNPAELLSSRRMRDLMDYLRTLYDVIFIDLPPVCQVSDAGTISDLVTGYAFVVRAATSDRRVIANAVDTMQGYGASLIGFILNDVDIRTGDYYKSGYSSYNRYSYSHRTYRSASNGRSYDTRAKRDMSYPSAVRRTRRDGAAESAAVPAPEATAPFPDTEPSVDGDFLPPTEGTYTRTEPQPPDVSGGAD